MTQWDFADEIFDAICGGNIAVLLITILLLAGVILLAIELGPGKAHPLSTALKDLGHTMNSEVIGRLERLETKDEEKGMKDARNRILRFSDECRRHEKHSKEFFDQILDDINEYETYCAGHPDFKNDKCREAVKNVREIYHKCQKEDDFI